MRMMLLCLFIVAPVSPVLAQAVMRGRVTNDSTERPVAGAEVVIEGTKFATITDSLGRFLITNIPTKVSYATIRKVGFRPVRVRLLVFGSDTVNIQERMVPTAVELPPIEVTAAAVPRGMEAFAERRAQGQGQFIDWKVLRAKEDQRVSTVIDRLAGISLELDRGGGLIVVSTRGQGGERRCSMSIMLDGTLIYEPGRGEPPNIDNFATNQLEAIEVYAASQLPMEFRGRNSGCGLVYLWTRRR